VGRRYFREEVFPMLTPLAVDASHPFPQLLNKSHNLLVRARTRKAASRSTRSCRCRASCQRLIPDAAWQRRRRAVGIHLPRRADQTQHRGPVSRLILDGVHAFRVTRNSDLYIDDEEADNLLRSIEQELRRSSRGNAVRLESRPIARAISASNFSPTSIFGAGSLSRRRPAHDDAPRAARANDAFANLKDRVFKAGPRSRSPAAREHLLT
jgi:polyphosphate kinase